jgi:small subunit ribosomal protein S4
MHGRESQFRPRRKSSYALQLREKQKARRIYGVLERQFRRYYNMAKRQDGLTGENLLIILERRLDNVVYRLGFASSRSQARQLVRHGHFELNGRRADIPSILVKPGDVISVKEKNKKLTYFKELAKEIEHRPVPDWMSRDSLNMTGRILGFPRREDINIPVNEQLIVEYYSR